MDKKRILVDLDVVTVACWDKGKNGDLARKFLSRINEFEMVTPFYLLNHLDKWKHIILKDQIESFYIENSAILISDKDIDLKIDERGLNDKEVLLSLQSHDVKEEDAFIVLVASLFGVDYLITFNRKHLRNKEKEIKEVLEKNGAMAIKIAGPEEV